MKIIPAVDILGGKVVRLLKGSFEDSKEYGSDPLSVAKKWQEEGAEYLHVVDLDGAKDGEPKNIESIEKIIKNVSISIEVGGGIRTPEHIERYLGLGADKVVLGSAVMHDLSFLDQDLIKNNLNKIALSIDAIREDDEVLPLMKAGTDGWKEEVPIMDFRGLLDRFVSVGIQQLNYTDRLKDGTLRGLSDADIKNLSTFLDAIKTDTLKVVYAGGISSLDDIFKLATLRSNKLQGLVIGKALYENNFTLRKAKEAGNVS